jgi:outer membrane immunogenic protein
MKKTALMVGAAILTFAAPGVASAQEAAPTAHPYIGVQAGLHNLGIDEDDIDTGNFDIDDSAMVYGVYGGVDFDVGGALVVGAEGNFSLGNGPIDSEYGVAGRIGVRAGTGSVIFARLGYQWVNLNGAGLLNIDEDLFDDDDLPDDTVDDYLVGVGADIGVGQTLGLRVAVDTISFDTLRPSVGLHLKF